jgi:hypothetical protein
MPSNTPPKTIQPFLKDASIGFALGAIPPAFLGFAVPEMRRAFPGLALRYGTLGSLVFSVGNMWFKPSGRKKNHNPGADVTTETAELPTPSIYSKSPRS